MWMSKCMDALLNKTIMRMFPFICIYTEELNRNLKKNVVKKKYIPDIFPPVVFFFLQKHFFLFNFLFQKHFFPL